MMDFHAVLYSIKLWNNLTELSCILLRSNNVDVYAIGIIYIEMRLGFKYALKFSEREYYFFVGGDTRRIVVKLPNDIFKLDNVEYDFIQKCLTYDYQDRPCISDICEHEYVKEFLQ